MQLKLVAYAGHGDWIIAGSRMARMRRAAGYQRGDLAKKLDIHPLELAMMELGYKKPNTELYEGKI